MAQHYTRRDPTAADLEGIPSTKSEKEVWGVCSDYIWFCGASGAVSDEHDSNRTRECIRILRCALACTAVQAWWRKVRCVRVYRAMYTRMCREKLRVVEHNTRKRRIEELTEQLEVRRGSVCGVV